MLGPELNRLGKTENGRREGVGRLQHQLHRGVMTASPAKVHYHTNDAGLLLLALLVGFA